MRGVVGRGGRPAVRPRRPGTSVRSAALGVALLAGAVLSGAAPPRARAATTTPAPAHTQAADTVTLTLQDALHAALASNPAYRQAVNRGDLNRTEWRTTLFDQVFPRAQVNLFSTQFTGNLTRRAVDNWGNPLPEIKTDWTYFSQTTQGVDLTWRIQGASIFNAVDRQRLRNLDRDAAEARALVQLEIQVRRAFWDAQEQAELLQAEESLVEARRTDLEVAGRLFALAMRTRVDVLTAELAVEQQMRAVHRQRTAHERARLALRTRLGDQELPPFRIADTPLPVFDPSVLDVESLLAQALGVNPELRQAGLAVRSAQVGLRQSRGAWWPTLVANFNLARRPQGSRGAALFDFSYGDPLDQRFYVGLQVPMFNDYFQNQQAIHRSSVELANSREGERETLLRVEEAVRGALLELESQWVGLRLAERSAEIAAEALRLAQEEYRIGTRTFGELRQSIDAEADTRRQVIQARYAFVDAILALEEAVGAPVAVDVGSGR